MALGRPLGAKVLLEGKEVPLIGATITSTVNQASIAYIDLVPQASIINIKPRTHVEIAVRDYNNAASGYPFITAWEGEVFGYSFSKQVNGRSFSVQAIDLSSYWDNVLALFINTNAQMDAGGQTRIAMGQDPNTANAQGFRVTSTVGGADISYFVQLMKAKLAEPGADFLDALFAVYESITEINDFYSAAESRFRIRDHVVIRSSAALGKLLDQANALKQYNGIVNRSGGFTSLRQVIQNLLAYIFHDFVPIPFPGKVVRTNLDGDPLPSSDNVDRTIGSLALKPSLYMVPPPMCNVFFPDEYSQFTFNRNFFREPTRLIYMPQMVVAQQGQPWTGRYIYEPPSFGNYMEGKAPWSSFKNAKDDFGVQTDPGYWGDPDTAASSVTNGTKKKDAQFLTNEERIKGIILSREAMLPLNTEWQAAPLTESSKTTYAQGVAQYLFYKKRYESRALQITSHLKMSVVPGFPVLLLDDSDAQQNVLAYCSSVTHRIYATQGGYTNVTLSYARTVDEQQQSSSADGTPLVPSFYASTIFAAGPPAPGQKSGLTSFYEALLGAKGSSPITEYSADFFDLPGSVQQLLTDYRKQRDHGADDVHHFIATLTARDYVTLRDSMAYKGASTKTKDLNGTKFVDFTGGAFDPANADFGSEVKVRFQPITDYRTALQTLRGFRG